MLRLDKLSRRASNSNSRENLDALRRLTIVAKKDAVKKESTETKDKETKSGFSLVNFTEETKEELAKVVWPSRQQLLSESAAVILMVILVATVIYLVDNFFAWGAGKVF
jgi:preprotein translocase subunit SecE